MSNIPNEMSPPEMLGAKRDPVNYRYDLMSPVVVSHVLHMTNASAQPLIIHASAMSKFLLTLPSAHDPSADDYLINHLHQMLQCSYSEMLTLYAEAMHEGALKYGERNWEKGLSEDNLINHAIGHLLKLLDNDQSENHKSHLVWNVLTLVHFRKIAHDNTQNTQETQETQA